ncbi:hypothetical protein T4C_2881 [Trichinella pseudospiralis]|uniref:Uncharacterized protein n=1 Tax=Trichinella pseudospiralis TaxID=6337 RepID=A0A0V1J1W9_TRIPS|nr:hypothetical protein T4C_2881 [Trichinella pseudospiralis]
MCIHPDSQPASQPASQLVVQFTFLIACLFLLTCYSVENSRAEVKRLHMLNVHACIDERIE